MLCPYCRNKESKVVDKRDNDERNVTRRRRECLHCHKRYTTYERIENVNLYVIKRSGNLEEYDRLKLKRGIMKAVKKRPITEEQVDELIDDVEVKLLNRQTTQIKSVDIGRMVLTRLRKLDPLGYLLFCTVYNGFESLDQLELELKQLMHKDI